MHNMRVKIPALFLLAILPAACLRSEKEDVDIQVFVEQHYPGCSEALLCKDLAYVDCNSAADGPSYYLERATGNRISTCGGACWFPRDSTQAEACRTLCPPEEWTCPR